MVDFKNKSVLEIGGGDGRLTDLLAKKARKVISVEKDKRFCRLLKEKFKDNKKVRIMCGDFLKYPPHKIDIIFGNIPYNISSLILFRLKEFDFEKAVLMLQKEFVLRMTAEPGTKNYGRLSVMSQFYFDISLAFSVDASCFTPKPKVDSIVLVLEKTENKMDKKTAKIINLLFQHKKRKLRNALLDSHKQLKILLKINKKAVVVFADSLEQADKRVFKLAREEIIDIAEKVKKWEKSSLGGEKKKGRY